MGEVYLARDSRLSRNVALKIIAPGSSDDALRRRRFEAEARAASSLNHPNIITVHDFGSTDGISYIVSELVEGESLRNLIHRGPIPIRQLLELAVQMADGLAAAHEAGIVHRDLKPENVMITRTGRVKILDFGLAKPMVTPVEADPGQPTFDGSPTEPGLILGTVGYMSPEQARGESVGVASDQFSMGVILHEMATGTPAFKRETPMQTLLAIVNVDRVPFTPGPVAFRLLVERCLAKDPAQRFASTAELCDRLRKILDGLPRPVVEAVDEPSDPHFESSSGSIVAPVVPRPQPSRHLATTVLGALAVFSLGLLAARVAAHSPRPDIESYHFAPIVSSDSIDAFPSLSPSGHTVAYAEPVDGTFQIFTGQASLASRTQRTKSDHNCFYPFWSPDGMRIYYISGGALWSVSETGGTPETVLPNAINGDASPRDGLLAILRRNANDIGESLWLMSPAGEPKRIERLPAIVDGSVKFSPDGNEIGVAGSTVDGSPGFWTISVAGGGVRQYPASHMRGFSFLSDSRHVLFGFDHLWRADSMSGDKSEITSGAGHENWPSVARDGHQTVFSTADIHYDLVGLTVAGEAAKLNVPAAAPYSNSSPVWSPKRPEFAYVTERTGSPEIRLRDAQSGWERRVARPADFSGTTLSFSDLMFSPDGQRVAYTRTTADGDAIWVSSPSGEQPVRLAAGSHPVWSPDGNWVAFTNVEKNQYALRKLHVGDSKAPALLRTGDAVTLGWSPDNNWLLAKRSNGRLLLVSSDGARTQDVGQASWLAATWSSNASHILGLRRTGARTLEIVSLSRPGVEESSRSAGAYPPALSFAEAAGLPAVSGFSLAPDGATVLLSTPRVRSDLWKATW
jgi:serine/threonine protein kinase